MKHKHLLPLVLPALLLALALSCKKEVSVEKDLPTIDPDWVVPTNIQGRVLNEQQEPVQGATVSGGGKTATTDINGMFLLENMVAHPNAAVVTVKKEGYFTGARTLTVSANGLHYIQVGLLPANADGAFNSTAGGKVQVDNCELSFSPNQVLQANNQPYNGMVSVSLAHLNPESGQFSDIMPGDLRGLDRNSGEVGLESFGMMAVELHGENGELLRLDSSKPVTFSMKIPSYLLSNAPAQIPLWYFDEKTGFWKEEGQALKTGSYYVGLVKHFSFWNCDVPFSLVDLKAVIQDTLGAPIPNAKVEIRRKADWTYLYSYTNDKGEILGKVPANTALEIRIYGRCGIMLYSGDFGPFTKDTDLGAIKTVLPQRLLLLNLEGTATNCANAPVQNGTVSLLLEGVHYKAAIDKGSFKLAIPRCNDTPERVILTAFDAATNISSAVAVTVATGIVKPQLQVCGTVSSRFINFKLDSSSITFSAPQDSISFGFGDINTGTRDTTWSISSHTPGDFNAKSIYMGFHNYSPGTHPLTFVFRENNTYVTGQNMTITITSRGGNGNAFEGSFSGTVRDTATRVQSQVSGTFKIK